MQYWGITLSAQQPLVTSVCLGNNKILVSQQTLMLLALYYIHVSCLDTCSTIVISARRQSCQSVNELNREIL